MSKLGKRNDVGMQWLGVRICCAGTVLATALIMAASAALLGCGSESAPPAPPAPDTKPPAVEPVPDPPTPPAPPTAPAAPPAEPAAAVDLGAADAVRGEAVYLQYCASCHGVRGAGDGPVGAALQPKPARHDDGAYMNGLSNEHLVKVVTEGGLAVGKSPLMAPWAGTLDAQQIADVVRFVRSLASPPYDGAF